jgi:membrane protease YdiL (CAAX protease family)
LPSVATFTGRAFVYHLGFASISEEPLFRGFLWGYLRRLGWKDIWIWPAQAAIFMSAHLYFIDALPFEFWIVVPLAGLILGLFAWWSRSIAPGMMAHAAFNASVYLILLRLLN